MNPKLLLPLYIFLLIFFGATQFVLTQFLTINYKSFFLILLILSFEICFILFGILIYYWIQYKTPFLSFWKNKLLIIAAIFSTLMVILNLYSSKPTRTPPFIQAVFSNLTIIFSVLFTKLILKKDVKYDLRFIIPSCIFLFIAICISLSQMIFIKNIEPINYLWIFIFVLGIVSRSLFNIYLEKYMKSTDSTDFDAFHSKVICIFYTTLFRIPMLFLFLPIEFLLNDNPLLNMKNDIFNMFTSIWKFLFLQIFIIFAVLFLIVNNYVNKISTNYNMIISTIIAPFGFIFFKIFPNLIPGITFTWYIILSTFLCCAIGIGLWLKGEKHDNNIYKIDKINEIDLEIEDV